MVLRLAIFTTHLVCLLGSFLADCRILLLGLDHRILLLIDCRMCSSFSAGAIPSSSTKYCRVVMMRHPPLRIRLSAPWPIVVDYCIVFRSSANDCRTLPLGSDCISFLSSVADYIILLLDKVFPYCHCRLGNAIPHTRTLFLNPRPCRIPSSSAWIISSPGGISIIVV